MFARFCLALILAAWCLLVCANAKNVEVELAHWWVSDAEQAALMEIVSAIEERDGKVTLVPLADYKTTRSKVLKQIFSGYPPAVTQWLGGKELLELQQLHSIRHLPEKWRGEKLEELLFPEVLAEVSHNDMLAGIPVVTHIQNTAFYNGQIYRDLSLSPPKYWEEVLEQAATIQKAGYTPLALSAQPWQLRMLFNTILIEKLGVRGFSAFYNPDKKIGRWKSQLIEALSLFKELHGFVKSPEQEIGWSDAVEQLAAGEAAMLVIGDFATGELSKLGKIAGKDFLCGLAPGSQQLMVYAIDSFVMLKVEETSLQTGQDLLFDVVLEASVQAAFNSKKGGIPVRKGVAMEALDVCTRQRYQRWLDDTVAKQRPSDTINPLRQVFVETMVHSVWTGKTQIREAVERMIQSADDEVK